MLNLRVHYNLLCEKDYAAEGLWYEQLSGYIGFFKRFIFYPRFNKILNQHKISDKMSGHPTYF